MHNSAAVRLLAADNAPVILALIAEYFPRGTRARPGQVLGSGVSVFESGVSFMAVV
ncbi:DUF3375 family protein [Corynebacterium tuberculostearicum]